MSSLGWALSQHPGVLVGRGRCGLATDTGRHHAETEAETDWVMLPWPRTASFAFLVSCVCSVCFSGPPCLLWGLCSELGDSRFPAGTQTAKMNESEDESTFPAGIRQAL